MHHDSGKIFGKLEMCKQTLQSQEARSDMLRKLVSETLLEQSCVLSNVWLQLSVSVISVCLLLVQWFLTFLMLHPFTPFLLFWWLPTIKVFCGYPLTIILLLFWIIMQISDIRPQGLICDPLVENHSSGFLFVIGPSPTREADTGRCHSLCRHSGSLRWGMACRFSRVCVLRHFTCEVFWLAPWHCQGACLLGGLEGGDGSLHLNCRVSQGHWEGKRDWKHLSALWMPHPLFPFELKL